MDCAAGTLFLCLTSEAGRINHLCSPSLLQLLYLELTSSSGWATKVVRMGIVTFPWRQLFQAGSGWGGVWFEGVCIVMCPCHTADGPAVSVNRQTSAYSCLKTKSAHLTVKISSILLSCVALFCFQADTLGGYCFRRILATGISPPLDSQQTGIRMRYLAEAVLLTDRGDLAVTSVLISLALLEFDTLEHEILAPLCH